MESSYATFADMRDARCDGQIAKHPEKDDDEQESHGGHMASTSRKSERTMDQDPVRPPFAGEGARVPMLLKH
jgi:hypothetical protein